MSAEYWRCSPGQQVASGPAVLTVMSVAEGVCQVVLKNHAYVVSQGPLPVGASVRVGDLVLTLVETAIETAVGTRPEAVFLVVSMVPAPGVPAAPFSTASGQATGVQRQPVARDLVGQVTGLASAGLASLEQRLTPVARPAPRPGPSTATAPRGSASDGVSTRPPAVGQPTPPDAALGSYGRRVGALCLDAALLAVVAGVVTFVLAELVLRHEVHSYTSFNGIEHRGVWHDVARLLPVSTLDLALVSLIAFLLVLAVIAIVYAGVWDGVLRGTLGKHLVGIRVVSVETGIATRGRIGLGRGLLRALVTWGWSLLLLVSVGSAPVPGLDVVASSGTLVLAMLAAAAIAISPLVDRNGQGLADKAARSVVVRRSGADTASQ